jgi:type I restriction enzyme S subunit
MPDVKSPKRTAGWTKVALGDVVRLCNERSSDPEADGFERYIGLEHLDPGELRVRRWGELADGVTFTNVFRPGQVLFGKRRAYQRKVAVAEFSGVCSGDIYVLEPKGDALLPELLPFICQTDAFFEHAVGTSAGSLSPRTNWESLADFEFDLAPIEEQRRIAEMLVAAADASDKMRLLADSSVIAHRSLCRTVFSIGKDGRPPASPMLAAGWQLLRLDAVAEFLDGKRVPLKSSDRSNRPGPFPYYGASGVIDHIDDYIFDESLVLLSEDGANLVDRSTPIAFEATGRYWVNNHAHVLRVRPPMTNAYLIHYIESLTLSDRISGTAQPKLTKAACESLPVPVPPAGELMRVTAAITASHRAVLDSQVRCKELSSLKRELLSRELGTEEPT